MNDKKTGDSPPELWAVVEIMGHKRYAGRVSEYSQLGVPLVRIEVPDVDGQPAFEKLFSGPAIYCVTPCDKEAALTAARQFRERPLSLVSLPMRDLTRRIEDCEERPEKYGPDYLDDDDEY